MLILSFSIVGSNINKLQPKGHFDVKNKAGVQFVINTDLNQDKNAYTVLPLFRRPPKLGCTSNRM